jgi:hypothetical protein
MSYRRVAPRDLFNESKLLKCLGKISVSILDGVFYEYGLTDELYDESEGFNIEQTEDGDIYCTNYKVFDAQGSEIEFVSLLNSRQPWPLYFYNPDEMTYSPALNDDGSISQEFFTFLEQ